MISLSLSISAAEMEDSLEDENIYIIPVSKKNKLNEKKGTDPAELTVFYENGKVQERNVEIGEKRAERVTNCKMFEG